MKRNAALGILFSIVTLTAVAQSASLQESAVRAQIGAAEAARDIQLLQQIDQELFAQQRSAPVADRAAFEELRLEVADAIARVELANARADLRSARFQNALIVGGGATVIATGAAVLGGFLALANGTYAQYGEARTTAEAEELRLTATQQFTIAIAAGPTISAVGAFITFGLPRILGLPTTIRTREARVRDARESLND